MQSYKSISKVANSQLSNLPEVLEEFLTKKIDTCAVVYINPEVSGGKTASYILSNYSFMVVDKARSNDNVKHFFAERYGGDGILSNGGGVRCGFDGEWQLKGLGANHLVGHDVDAGHSDGNLALETAIYETIWAEAINVALPYGAVRTVAIMDAGSDFSSWKGSLKRSLLVRLPAVRPAHFIRSIYFKQKNYSPIGEDALRVRNSIRRLHEFLPLPKDRGEAESVLDVITLGMTNLSERYAKQFAAARAKNIAHYNVSASNISMDGSWLDLSGARFFSDVIQGDRLSVDKYENEYLPVLQALLDICFYLRKYEVISGNDARRLHDLVIEKFFKSYNKFLDIYQAARTGVPFNVLRELESAPEFELFSASLREISKLENFSVRAVHCAGAWSGYEFCFSRVFYDLYNVYTLQDDYSSLSWAGKGQDFVAVLCSRYNELMNTAIRVAKTQGIDIKNFMLAVKINMIRLNRFNGIFMRLESLIGAISYESCKDSEAPVGRLVEDALFAAKLNLENEKSLMIPFWFSRKVKIWFNPKKGVFFVQGDSVHEMSVKIFFANSEKCTAIEDALGFYGWARREFNEV